jgi:hypothetical protein
VYNQPLDGGAFKIEIILSLLRFAFIENEAESIVGAISTANQERNINTHTHTHTHTYIYIYIYIKLVSFKMLMGIKEIV